MTLRDVQPVRQPETRGPGRITPLATLPVFYRLTGKQAVLVGATEGALWKAELLAACGADLTIIAPEFGPGFEALAAHPPAGSVQLRAREWQPDDLLDAAIAIADLEDAHEAEAFVAAARAAGAAYNVIDKPEFCAFQFGSIVNRSPLVIGISTDGAAPVFGQAIRTKIEALLPRGLSLWAEAARDWRPLVQARALAYAARRAFWERFTRIAMLETDRRPGDDDRDQLIASLDQIEASAGNGKVTLVGAGPGDPELLTLKAVRVLQSADIILYDDLVSDGVLDLARREAKRMLVGKKGHGPSCKQEEINALMVKLAREGKHVVRLKSGDPGIFGRATEELDACRELGIPVAIVPGITSAQGAAASLGISLTERAHARRLQFVTGHARDGQLPHDLDWAAMADAAATTIIYMPRKTLAQFRDAAVAAGLSPDMPALAILNATRPDELHRAARIQDLPDVIQDMPEGGPMLVMIGQVAAGQVAAGLARREAALVEKAA